MTITDYTEKHGGYWEGEDPESPLADWKYEVANDDTRLGYWEWAYERSLEGDE